MKQFAAIHSKQWTAGLFGSAFFAACLALPAHSCELLIVWKADLAPVQSASAASPVPTGTAAIQFDFTHPGATMQVNTKNLPDARRLELHVSRSYSDHIGPAVASLNAVKDGPLPGAFTWHLSEADLHKQTSPKIASFADLVQAVMNGRAYVTVGTLAHPEGVMSGFITMRKEAIYTDTPGNISHDPALHHAAAKPLP